MMNQENWEALFKAFDEEEPWWEGNYADENEFEGLNLMDWLECDSRGPDWNMVIEFVRRGYDVFPVENDSFGWLVGGVRRKLDPSGKVITFG